MLVFVAVLIQRFVAGMDMDNPNRFLVYRLENGDWKKLTDKNWFYRIAHSCQLLTNDRLVIIGGGQYAQNVDVLHLRSLTWSEV